MSTPRQIRTFVHVVRSLLHENGKQKIFCKQYKNGINTVKFYRMDGTPDQMDAEFEYLRTEIMSLAKLFHMEDITVQVNESPQSNPSIIIYIPKPGA